MDMDLGPLVGLFMQTIFIGFTMKALSIIIFVLVYGRMLHIYLLTSLAPLPMAALANREIGGTGQNYIKSLFAIGFQGLLMLVCVGIYGVLIQGISMSGDPIGAIWGTVGYTVLLCFMLFKTGSISASSAENSYINALDLSSEYGDGKNPLVLKSEFIMSLCEQLMGAGEIGAKEKSIIDRCTANIYREYIKDFKGEPPTLKDLHRDLMMQKEPAAHDIALALELFTTGSLDVFSHQTNINTKSRILCFDIQDLGENLKPIGLLVMLDAIFNRVIQNRREGKYTHVYIDEIYLFFAGNSIGNGRSINNYSGEFLYKCWKRFRKYGATLTGITQNVEECLLSDTARMMFANSEFLLMFNQAATDREELSRLMGTSSTQMDYVSDAPAGHGLIKVGGGIVPFVNEFPKDTSLYWLMTTKPGEG